jgi:hypothetical protein
MSADAGLDEFRVSSVRDIGALLKQLLDGSILLNLNGSDGRVFTSAIWTLDSTRGTIGFNADPNDPAMQSVLHSREVTVVGYLESVKVQFDVQNLVLVHGNKASVLSCPFPREMYASSGATPSGCGPDPHQPDGAAAPPCTPETELRCALSTFDRWLRPCSCWTTCRP